MNSSMMEASKNKSVMNNGLFMLRFLLILGTKKSVNLARLICKLEALDLALTEMRKILAAPTSAPQLAGMGR